MWRAVAAGLRATCAIVDERASRTQHPRGQAGGVLASDEERAVGASAPERAERSGAERSCRLLAARGKAGGAALVGARHRRKPPARLASAGAAQRTGPASQSARGGQCGATAAREEQLAHGTRRGSGRATDRPAAGHSRVSMHHRRGPGRRRGVGGHGGGGAPAGAALARRAPRPRVPLDVFQHHHGGGGRHPVRPPPPRHKDAAPRRRCPTRWRATPPPPPPTDSPPCSTKSGHERSPAAHRGATHVNTAAAATLGEEEELRRPPADGGDQKRPQRKASPAHVQRAGSRERATPGEEQDDGPLAFCERAIKEMPCETEASPPAFANVPGIWGFVGDLACARWERGEAVRAALLFQKVLVTPPARSGRRFSPAPHNNSVHFGFVRAAPRAHRPVNSPPHSLPRCRAYDYQGPGTPLYLLRIIDYFNGLQ
ncbi:Protein of unknown function [Gryllus bimaculatus]|nr:Protein of unknown function [Gryllus bimaculatus]